MSERQGRNSWGARPKAGAATTKQTNRQRWPLPKRDRDLIKMTSESAKPRPKRSKKPNSRRPEGAPRRRIRRGKTHNWIVNNSQIIIGATKPRCKKRFENASCLDTGAVVNGIRWTAGFLGVKKSPLFKGYDELLYQSTVCGWKEGRDNLCCSASCIRQYKNKKSLVLFRVICAAWPRRPRCLRVSCKLNSILWHMVRRKIEYQRNKGVHRIAYSSADCAGLSELKFLDWFNVQELKRKANII